MSVDSKQIKQNIRKVYTDFARKTEADFVYPTGREGAEELDYPKEILDKTSETLPFQEESFNVVTSNGAPNLSLDKRQTFSEIFRVLKPGGSLQFADLMLKKTLPQELIGSLEAWSHWIGGAIPVGDQIALLKEVGFIDVNYLGDTPFSTSKYTTGSLFKARKQWFLKSPPN